MGRNAEDITQELKQRFTQIWRLNGAYDPETLAALTYYVAVLLEYRNELKPSALPAAATSIADLVAELRHDYGEYHPATCAARTKNAEILQAMGQYEEARTLFRKSADGFEQAYGKANVSVLDLRNKAADCLAKLGRFSEALPEFMDVLEQQRHILGPHDPDTLLTWTEVMICLD